MRKLLFSIGACSFFLAVQLISANIPAIAAEMPNAGTILRDSLQNERILPKKTMLNLKVQESIKQPMAIDNSFKVFVKTYRISGQDVFTQEELLNLLKSYTSQEMTMQRLQEATNVISRHFREKGYFVTQAYLPEQEIEDGVVEISVMIGRCGDIILKNKSNVPDIIIRQQLAEIKTGDYIHTSNMERATLLASDLIGVSAKTTLIPGKKPGTTDVVIEASPKGTVWQGSVSANNYGSRLTGYKQGTISLAMNNPTLQGDSVSVSVGRTDKHQDTFGIFYHLPLSEGSSFNLSYSKLYYELGAEMSYLNAYGKAYTQHLDWTYSLQRSRNNNLTLQLGYDHKRLQDITDYSGSITNKSSHAISMGILGDNTDSIWGGGSNSYSLQWYDGGTGGEENTGLTLTTGNWNKVTYSFIRQQYIQDRLSLYLSLNGQRSSTNLDSSEKLSLGGANAVRAYPSGEAAGDEAWLTTAEFRYSMPAINGEGGFWQIIAFYDKGVSHTEKTQTTGGQNRRSISGIGLGASYIMPGDYTLKATYAWKLSSEAAQADTTFDNGRLWLQGVKYF